MEDLNEKNSNKSLEHNIMVVVLKEKYKLAVNTLRTEVITRFIDWK